MKLKDRAIWGRANSPNQFAAALGVILLNVAFCQAQAIPQSSQEKVLIEDVIPQGNHNVSTQRIMSLLKTRPGKEYDREVVKEDVRRLYKTQAFADIRVEEAPGIIDKKKIIVYFQFREQPSLVQDIIYQGAKHFKPDKLDSITGLKKGVPLNPFANQQTCQAILREYYEKGRGLATVYLAEGGQPGDTRVVFNITEGPVIKVSGIDFTGVHFVTDARLKTQVNSSSEFLHLIGGKYNPLMVDQDVLALEKYYRGFGFHDVRVSRELQWEDESHVRIIFHVQEGQRYRVASVDVGPSSTMSRDEIMPLIKLQKGEYYNEHESEADQARIKAAIGYRGREVMTHERLTWPGPNQVVVYYELEEQPPARVGQIIIYGNDVTKDIVIRRQIPLYPGQILTYPDLRVAEQNLARLNIFESNPETGVRPTVEVDPRSAGQEYRDILVHVQETPTGSLLFGVGVNSDAGLTGSIVLNERNFDILRWPTSIDDLLSGHAFRGAGQEFRIEAVPGLASIYPGAAPLQRYVVSWREPYLFDSPYSLGVSGYFFDRLFLEYTESRLGTRITVGRRLNQYWSVSGTLRVEEVGVHSVVFFAPQDFQSVVGENFAIGMRAGVTRDTRDSYLRPTEGSLVDAGFEEVVGDFNYPIFSMEANKYWTVWQRPDGSGRHVLAARSQLDIESSHTPVYDRFYAGGFRSMRGFEFRGVGPDIEGFKVGGFFMWLNSLEYQVPIKSNDNIYLVGFVDSGTVNQTYTLDEYRVSAGFGVRVVVPLLGPVPIALDFGFPIVKAPADIRQIFSFWVGFFN